MWNKRFVGRSSPFIPNESKVSCSMKQQGFGLARVTTSCHDANKRCDGSITSFKSANFAQDFVKIWKFFWLISELHKVFYQFSYDWFVINWSLYTCKVFKVVTLLYNVLLSKFAKQCWFNSTAAIFTSNLFEFRFVTIDATGEFICADNWGRQLNFQ